MQMFQIWVSDICKYFLLLDKNVAIKLLSKKEGGHNYNPASFIWNLLDLGNLLDGLGDEAGKVLRKIYNQDIS